MKKIINPLIFLVYILFVTVSACDITDETNDESSSIGTVQDMDGNLYNTVKIGSQFWTVENLKTTKYNDGTEILNGNIDTLLDNDESGAFFNYGNQESNVEIYGRLYNWYAVNTGKLAPEGWHVPTEYDWKRLENFLIANSYNYDGTKVDNKVAKSLCAITNWELSNVLGSPGFEIENNNRTGFAALPGGYRDPFNNYYDEVGKFGYWWSSSEYSFYRAFHWGISHNEIDLHFFTDSKRSGLSVRLIHD